MKLIKQNKLTTYTLAIGSTLLITAACIFFIGFLSQFFQYAMDMLSMASSETNQYLQTIARH